MMRVSKRVPRHLRDRPTLFFQSWLFGLLLAANPPHTLQAAGHATIVSLTFDDGLMQSAAITALLDTGLSATFYVNSDAIRRSGRINNNDFLTKRELDTLFYNGDDIGGHTIDHVDLATLSDAAQRKAVCDDLKQLRQWYGNAVYSFAYPFASTGPATRDIVAGGCPGTYGPFHICEDHSPGHRGGLSRRTAAQDAGRHRPA